MPISRYDLPAQANYQSTYVPVPFDQMIGIGERMAARREEGLAQANQMLANLQDFPVAPGDEPWYQENIVDLQKDIDDAVSTLDPGSFEFKRKISSIARKQLRDPNWRVVRQNYQPYWQAVKTLQENQDLPLSNRRALQEYVNRYNEVGARGMGYFQAPGVVPYTDYTEPLEKMGQGFIKQGIDQGYLNADGTLKFRSKQSGIFINEVANTYGYDYDTDSGEMSLKRIPVGFEGSPAGQQMMMEAVERAAVSGKTPDEEFVNMYVSTTAPMVYKYSGMEYTEDVDITPLAAKMLEMQADQETITLLGDLDKRMKNLVGSEFGEKSAIKTAMLALPAGLRGRVMNVIKGFEPKAGQSLEETLDSIDAAFGTDAVPADNPALRGIMNITRKALSEIAKFAYSTHAQEAPCEDYKIIAEKAMKAAGMEGTWESLDKEGREKIHKLGAQYVKEFWDKDVHTPFEVPTQTKVRAKMANIIFGSSSDNGIVRGEDISSAGMVKKVIDPRNPNEKELILNDLVSKNSTVEYLGRASYDNPYDAGLHVIAVDGLKYYMYYSEEDKLEDAIPYMLYDYSRNPAGLGQWFPQQDYYLRGVERDGVAAIEVLTEEQYNKAVQSGQIKVNSKTGESRGRAANAQVFTAGQGQSIVNVFDEQFVPFTEKANK